MSPDPPERPDPVEPAAPVEPDHAADGLELARARARAAAATRGTPARRRRTGPRRRDAVDRGATGDRRLGGYSGAHPDERDPQLLGGEVDKLVANQGWELDLRMRGVFARWSELVGEEVAGHCAPASFTDGLLVVRTESTAWATQLRLLVPQLLRRLNADLGEGTVRLIEVEGPAAPRWGRGRRAVRGARGPRDTYG